MTSVALKAATLALCIVMSLIIAGAAGWAVSSLTAWQPTELGRGFFAGFMAAGFYVEISTSLFKRAPV